MRFDDLVVLDVETVEQLQAHAINEHGGSVGVLNRGMLESAVAAPLASFGGVLIHDTLCKMAAALAYPLARNHAFVDGNKRVALLAAGTFLEANGLTLPASPHWEALFWGLAEGTVQRDELARAFAVAVGGDVEIED